MLKKILMPLFIMGALSPCPQAFEPFRSLSETGDFLSLALPVSGLLLATSYHDREGQAQMIYSALATAALTHTLKHSMKHSEWSRRPSGGRYSFPSGHTSSAFQGALFIKHRYGSLLGIPAVGLAALTGYSRLQGHHHHVRDVLAGAALAYVVDWAIVSPYTGTQVGFFSKEDAVGVSIRQPL